MSNLILNLIAISLTATMNLNDLVIYRPTDNGLEIGPEKSGIGVFLNDPTRYNFLCTDQSRGEVLSAKLTNDGALRLTYNSFWSDGNHSGVVTGTFNAHDNKFKGKYETNDGRFSGEINFNFNEKGEAHGTWDHGYGQIKISLKKEYVAK